jgi:hypothetical protein
MKTLTMKIAILTAATLFSALPVLAGEGAGMGMSSGESAQKDECLLVSQNCRDSVDSIQQRIDRLNREIAKGSSVYTDQELGRLKSQLRETSDMLRSLTEGA